jgi:hypothetical protein
MKNLNSRIIVICLLLSASNVCSKEAVHYLSVLGGNNGIGIGYSMYWKFLGIQFDVPFFAWFENYPNEKWGLTEQYRFGFNPSLKFGLSLINYNIIHTLIGIKTTQSIYIDNSTYKYHDSNYDTTMKYYRTNNYNQGIGPFFELLWYEHWKPKGGLEIGMTLFDNKSGSYYSRIFGQVFINIKELFKNEQTTIP